jgi:hypothetical protein
MSAVSDLAAAFPEPIAAYVQELATSEDVPVVAIGACLVRFQEAGPLLRQVLARATDDGIENESQAAQLFRTLHILGGARDSLSFSPLLRFLQGPADKVDWLLGDASTETLPRIIAGVFDGNADALFKAIVDRKLDWTIRSSLLGAATFLTWEGRIDRRQTTAFLEQFARDAAEDEEVVWTTWADAIALLGLRDLEPLVSDAEKRGLLDDLLFDRGQFEAQLAQATQAPNDKTRFEDVNLGCIDDVLGALQQFPYAYDDDKSQSDDWQDPDEDSVPQPVINPWRNVGRNDPCPCGSGKKAKRCCLAA